MDATDWEDPAWRTAAMAWVDERLAETGRRRTGEPTQPHVRPWATALRVPTDGGPVWFKASVAAYHHEAAAVQALAARVPERVPPLLAADPARGWLLMADAGERLREVVARERTLHRWHDVLRGVAALERAVTPDVNALLTAGVPDLRLETLADRYAELVTRRELPRRYADAVPLVRDLVAELAAYGVPDSLQHDDLHDGQVFVKDGRNLVLDWGDSCISHPFFTLSVCLQGGVAWGLDDVEGSEDIAPYVASYLDAFAGPGAGRLATAIPAALRLGWACRAVNGDAAGDHERTPVRLQMFLDGRIEQPGT